MATTEMVLTAVAPTSAEMLPAEACTAQDSSAEPPALRKASVTDTENGSCTPSASATLAEAGHAAGWVTGPGGLETTTTTGRPDVVEPSCPAAPDKAQVKLSVAPLGQHLFVQTLSTTGGSESETLTAATVM